MDFIVGILFEFGLGIIALLILVSSAIHAKSVRTVFIRGIIAMILLGLNCALLIFLTNYFAPLARPDITRRGEAIDKVVIFISVFSLIIYFPVAVLRAKQSQKNNGGG